MDEETGPRSSNLAVMGTRAALLAGALLLGACGGGGGEASSATLVADDPTTTTASRATTTTTDPEEAIRQEVEDAYYAQLDAFVEIFADPDPTNPLIDRYFTGEQREQLLTAVSRNLAEGTALRRPEDPALYRATPLSIDVQDGTALVRTCIVDGLVVYKPASGEVVNDAVVTLHLTLTFKTENGEWKVSRAQQDQRLDGVHECDD